MGCVLVLHGQAHFSENDGEAILLVPQIAAQVIQRGVRSPDAQVIAFYDAGFTPHRFLRLRQRDSYTRKRLRCGAIPFRLTIPEEKQDKLLASKLLTELPEISSWYWWDSRALREEGRFTTATLVMHAVVAPENCDLIDRLLVVLFRRFSSTRVFSALFRFLARSSAAARSFSSRSSRFVTNAVSFVPCRAHTHAR